MAPKIKVTPKKQSKFFMWNNIPIKLILKKNLEKFLNNKFIGNAFEVAMTSIAIFAVLLIFLPVSWKSLIIAVGIYFVWKEFHNDVIKIVKEK